MDQGLCYLNRKPYRDRLGTVRVRDKCCGKRTACTLATQPDGKVLKTGGPLKKRKAPKVVVEEKRKKR